MELRRLSILTFFVLAAIFGCTESRHSIQRRASDDVDNYDEEVQNDRSSDYGTQNDADGGNDADEMVVEAKILSKGQTFNLTLNQALRLECLVDPKDGAIVQWTKEDGKGEKQMIAMSETNMNNKRIYLEKGSTNLVIKDLTAEDAGKYTCTIIQLNEVSITHTLVVYQHRQPTIRFWASDNGAVKEGDSLLLTCQAQGEPTPSLMWSRKKIHDTGLEKLTEAHGEFTGDTFFMRNVTKQDSGTYYCYAVNSNGGDEALLQVTVTGVPRVHVHKPVINTDINTEAILECSAHDDPTAMFQWFKDDQLIETDSISRTGTVSTLTVTPQRDEDFGTYTCRAINQHGNHSKSISLVQSPVIENFHAEDNKLSWTVLSHQPLEAIEVHVRHMDGEDPDWKTYEVPLPETKTREYELIYVLDKSKLQDGTYEATVKVKNNKDWSQVVDSEILHIAREAEAIQKIDQAGIFGSTGNAHSIRQSTFALSTILMYLLVRMF